jgi:triosephosphate isomerase
MNRWPPQREAGETDGRLAAQTTAALKGLPENQAAGLVIAYEPIWAIGTGVNATGADAQQACAHLRQVVGEVVGDEAAQGVRIQYGGSVRPDNTAELMGQRDVDGLLVGGASLDAATFAAIIREAGTAIR